MKVTKIQQQAKRNDRYSVYVDEKYSFSLSDYQLVGSGLKVGMEFSPKQLEEFINESQFGKAYERALNYSMIRPRSQYEVNQYLIRTFLFPRPKVWIDKKGNRQTKQPVVNAEQVKQMIERIIERLVEKEYINDQSFALSWVRSRQLHKKSSKRKLEQELRLRGVDSKIIATVLQNEILDDNENLKSIIEKKRRLTRYQDAQKLTQYLVRQGFHYEDIKTALSEKE